MSKNIDIIIPAYNAHKTISDTLYSIAYQKDLNNVKVTIVNDVSDKDYSEEVKHFSNFFDIREIKMKTNSGPGAARQYGIDNTNGEYIVFIDSDDCFASPYSIEILKANMDKDTDIVISNFFEEEAEDTIIIERSMVWLHGKMYRRKFLDNKNIRFRKESVNEDTGFNQLCLLRDARCNYIEDITYTWRYNLNSITRKNNFEYDYTSVMGFARSIADALDDAKADKYNKDYFKHLSHGCLISIYCFYLNYMEKYDMDFLNKLFKIAKRIKKYKDEFTYDLEFENEIFSSYITSLIEKFEPYRILNPIINFDQFLELIDEV